MPSNPSAPITTPEDLARRQEDLWHELRDVRSRTNGLQRRLSTIEQDYVRLAETRAPRDDVNAQFSWRSVQAKLKARGGDVAAGTSLGLEAVKLVEATDALTEHGHVLLDFAEVLRLANRIAEGANCADEALSLFERKGNVASVTAARTFLASLSPA